MKLRYPLSSELITFVHLLVRTIERGLRNEHGLSIVQYRILSALMQADRLDEGVLLRMLDVSASQLSQALGDLAGHNYIEPRRIKGPAKQFGLTSAGRRLTESADATLVAACDQVFGPLGKELGAAIRAGSMLTNQRHGIIRIENGRFFEEHACFEAFLEAEHITKESTRAFGLTHTEFRILFELLCAGPTSKSSLAKTLKLTPSVVTDTCKKLIERGLVIEAKTHPDRRTRIIALAESARDLTERCAEHVDARNFEDLRPSSDGERSLYQQMADIVVHKS